LRRAVPWDFFCESLSLRLIGELPEFVEIDTLFEPKGMENRLWRPFCRTATTRAARSAPGKRKST
jgi:hypothetical protein